MSKATEGDSAVRPSRSSDRSRTVFSSVSVVERSRSDGGPMPSGTNGSERHRSRSGERGRRDRGHGSERCHESSRFHHSTRHRESGERARPTSSSGGSSSRSMQADSMDVPGYGGASGRVTDVRPSTSTHHQHHHSPCPLHLRASVGHTSEAETAGRLSRSSDKKKILSSGVSVVGRSRCPTAAQCLPGPTDLNAIDYAVMFGADEVTGRRDFMTHQGPVTRQDIEGVGSGPGTRLREGPALEPGMLTRRMFRGLAVLRGGRRRSGLLVLPLNISVITQGHRWIVGQVRIPASWQTWECGQREVWVVIHVQTWGPVVPGRSTTNWEKNHHSDPFASQTSGDGRLGRCDGSSRLVNFGWLSRCDGPDGLGRGTGLSRLWVSKGSRLHSGGRARDCVRLNSCCWPSTVSGPSRFRLSTPTASNLLLLRRDVLLKNFGFQPQVLSTVRTAPSEGSHVLGPEPKVLQNTVRTIRQADRMAGSSFRFAQRHRDSKSSTEATSSKKTTTRTSVFDCLGSPTATTTQRTVTQEPPFRAGADRAARHRPYSDSRKKSGKYSAVSSTRQRWRVLGGGSPGRLCPALAESTGQLPGHRHCRGRGGQCIPATTSAHPSVHQLLDQKQPSGPPASCRCFAAEGSHRAGHQRDFPRVLQPVVPGPKEDKISAACNRSLHSQPPHGSSTLQDGDAMVRPFSHQKSGVDGIGRHARCLPSCSDAPGRPQVSTHRGQQASVPVHLSPLWVSDFSTRVHQAAAARHSAVKAARCEATRLLRQLADQSRYSGNRPNCTPRQPTVCSSCSAGSSTTRSQTSFQVRTSSSSGCSSTLDNSQWRPYWRCVSKSSPFISTGLPTRTWC